MEANLDESCYGYVIELNCAKENAMPESKASIEQKLKQVGISQSVNYGLFGFPHMHYLTVPGGDAFALWQKLANN
ncbi:MAG: hypothetical protein C0508_26850, partial [Cyanobacteria bacterium PR.023]|nr:hypothetical protein [Cyanobacteria bacterium PR.023]